MSDPQKNTSTEIENDKCFTNFETNLVFKMVTAFFNFYVPLIGMNLIYLKIFLTIKNRTKLEFNRKFSIETKCMLDTETSMFKERFFSYYLVISFLLNVS
jgi:hypothetical protein